MKILIVNHEFSVTGASLMLLQIADRLAVSGHACAVYSASGEPGPIAWQRWSHAPPLGLV